MKGSNPNNFRHSIRAMCLEAYCNCKRVSWGSPCGSVTLHIHGSKTDWLNCGAVRSHGALPTDHPHKEICLVRNLLDLHQSFPERFTDNVNRPFDRLVNDVLITDRQLTLVVKRAASPNGLNPLLYSLHSLRAGGATSLFRATGDVDLVGMFGRWKGGSIHSYLWESHVMLQGIASLMTQKDEP